MVEEDRVEQLVQETRAFVELRPEPDLTTAVMRQIDAERVERTHLLRSWHSRFVRQLWMARRVSVELRPAYALVAAAVIVALAIPVQRLWHASVEHAMAERADAAGQKVLVQFRLQASDATDVRLAGSFTGWRPEYELHQTAPGLWTITLPLSPGVHDYAFVIDGRRWVTDPFAVSVQDGFGGTNSRLTLIAGDDRRL